MNGPHRHGSRGDNANYWFWFWIVIAILIIGGPMLFLMMGWVT